MSTEEDDMRRIHIAKRVRAFFAGDVTKLRAWLRTANPLLGGAVPTDLWADDRGLAKLEKFVYTQLAENPPAFHETLARLRAAGWMVAVHNDYRQDGKLMTFWLFTRADETGKLIAVKGEGSTDDEALAQVFRQAAALEHG
jgi:hypothetical protein